VSAASWPFADEPRWLQGALPLEPAAAAPQQAGEEVAEKQLPGRGGGYEPTMTISTKAAFDAINQMFKVTGGARGCCL
jgi:hypothetical protein